MNKKIHKDFHGAFSYMLIYLEKNYGRKVLNDYLIQVAKNVYGGLSEKIKRQGLNALEKHLKKIFEIEDAEYKISRQDVKLVLDVKCCPAIEHMRKRGYPVMKKFCECDRIITAAICKNAGIESSIRHDQKKGKCIQEFRKGGR